MKLLIVSLALLVLSACGDDIGMSPYCTQGTTLTADMHCQAAPTYKEIK